jgi:hypothetical protein
MFLIGLGALVVLGGVSYIPRNAIWRGSLSGPDSSRRPVRDTLEPPRRGMGFLGSERTGPAFSLWQLVQLCWCRGPVSSLGHPCVCRTYGVAGPFRVSNPTGIARPRKVRCNAGHGHQIAKGPGAARSWAPRCTRGMPANTQP